MKKEIVLGMVTLLVIVTAAGTGTAVVTWSRQVAKTQKQYTVVIDPGHGGVDPGKVGVHEEKEKDINLEIALRLKELLEKEKYTVIMTRETDQGLYQETDSNKKLADLQARCALINDSNVDIAVSIHQNSYPDGSVKGAQVFYQTSSEQGKILADTLQNQIITDIADGNKRTSKANDNYYMLLHTSVPMVIVECGFLSSPEEAALLCDTAYQQKMAQAIADGIDAYLTQNH